MYGQTSFYLMLMLTTHLLERQADACNDACMHVCTFASFSPFLFANIMAHPHSLCTAGAPGKLAENSTRTAAPVSATVEIAHWLSKDPGD